MDFEYEWLIIIIVKVGLARRCSPSWRRVLKEGIVEVIGKRRISL